MNILVLEAYSTAAVARLQTVPELKVTQDLKSLKSAHVLLIRSRTKVDKEFLDRAPELRDLYFSHYTRVVLLAQTDDDEVTQAAAAAAERLGLRFERILVGRTGLQAPVREWSVTIARAAA